MNNTFPLGNHNEFEIRFFLDNEIFLTLWILSQGHRLNTLDAKVFNIYNLSLSIKILKNQGLKIKSNLTTITNRSGQIRVLRDYQLKPSTKNQLRTKLLLKKLYMRPSLSNPAILALNNKGGGNND